MTRRVSGGPGKGWRRGQGSTQIDPVGAFWAKVEKTPGCWLWLGWKDKEGYGHHRLHGKHDVHRMAHRIAFEIDGGVLIDGLTIDHLCNNRSCVRPDHLKQVTIRENVLRSDSLTAHLSRQTHCKRGHPLSGPNLRIARGLRVCRKCKAAASRRKYRMDREAAL